MEANQDNDGPPAAAEGQDNVSPPASLELKMYRACRENRLDLLQRLINDTRAGITSESCDVYEDDEIEHDEAYYSEFEREQIPGWTCLHIAAFHGNTECVKIILNEGVGKIDAKANDGSTPLMVSCANLPDTVECIKLMCEYDQDLNHTNEREFTALEIAIAWKPVLEVIQLLVGKGADTRKSEGWSQELMMLLFMKYRQIELDCPLYVDPGRQVLTGRQAEIAEIAMYLANQGCVKGALRGLLKCSKWVIQSPHLLEQVLECFLENGAVLNDLQIERDELQYSPLALSLFAKKSIIYLEGIKPSFGDHCFWKGINTIIILLLQGLTCGIIPHAYVTQAAKNRCQNFRPLPLETLDAMTRSVPSLQQLARTKIRRQMADCGKFSRENLQKLELTRPMIDFVQLEDLDGSKVTEIWPDLG